MTGGFMRMLARMLAVLTSRRHDEDLEQELEAHLAMLVDDYRRSGLRDARRAATVALGGRAQVREEHRRARGLQWLEDLIAPYLTRFQIVGRSTDQFLRRPLGGFKVVSPSYFQAVGLRLLAGRLLEGVDPFDNRVAEPTVYATREQHPRANLALVVRTDGDPALMQEAVRRTVSGFDPDQALADVEPLEKLAPAGVAPDRLRSLLLSMFAAIAVALAGSMSGCSSYARR